MSSPINTTDILKRRIVSKKPIAFSITCTLHFVMKLLSRNFELTEIVRAYLFFWNNRETIEIGKKYEFTGTKSTIVCSLDSNGTIHLITGWIGSRNKKGN